MFKVAISKRENYAFKSMDDALNFRKNNVRPGFEFVRAVEVKGGVRIYMNILLPENVVNFDTPEEMYRFHEVNFNAVRGVVQHLPPKSFPLSFQAVSGDNEKYIAALGECKPFEDGCGRKYLDTNVLSVEELYLIIRGIGKPVILEVGMGGIDMNRIGDPKAEDCRFMRAYIYDAPLEHTIVKSKKGLYDSERTG